MSCLYLVVKGFEEKITHCVFFFLPLSLSSETVALGAHSGWPVVKLLESHRLLCLHSKVGTVIFMSGKISSFLLSLCLSLHFLFAELKI